MKLVIPVAGKGSRLSRYHLPKGILPFKGTPTVFCIIEYWKETIDEVILIVSESNKKIYETYFARYFTLKIPVRFVIQTNTDSTNGTIAAINSVYDCVANEPVILNWCDVILEDRIGKLLVNPANESINFVVCSNEISCRWEFENERFTNRKENIVRPNGIIGVFIINQKFKDVYKPKKIESVNEIEFLEILESKNFSPIQTNLINDIGDEKKYTSIVRLKDKVKRAHGSGSSVHISCDVIKVQEKKTSILEAEWLINHQNIIKTPMIKSKFPLVMERIFGDTIAKLLDNGKISESEAIHKGFQVLKRITKQNKRTYDRDIESERLQYLYGPQDKVEDTNFLRTFPLPETINKFKVVDPINLLPEVFEVLKNGTTAYNEIHGDLQLSNIMINTQGEAVVIDPRPIFGNCVNYGDIRYDIAKLYYGFIGCWDWFSEGNGSYLINDGNCELNHFLDNNEWNIREELFYQQLSSNFPDISLKEIKLIHAIIWLRATNYVVNDTISSNYAYLFGTYLLNKNLKNE